MTRLIGVTAALALTLLGTTNRAQPARDHSLERASLAWDRGDYPAALAIYLQLLDSSKDESVLESIASQTGELYHATELTVDGAAPQFSPTGEHLTYETGVAPARRIRLLRANGNPTPVAELRGFGATFSRDGTRLAYLRLDPSPDLLAAHAELEKVPPAERTLRAALLNGRQFVEARIVVRELASGRETDVDTGSMRKSDLLFGIGERLLFAGQADGSVQQIYSFKDGQGVVPLTTEGEDKIPVSVNSDGSALLFSTRGGGGARGTGPAAGGGGRGAPGAFSLMNVADGKVTPLPAVTRPTFSADGRSLTFVAREADDYAIVVAPASDPAAATTVTKRRERVDAPALSADGSRVAYQAMVRDDWEIFVVNRDGGDETRVTREIQHDLLPQFLSDDRILAVIGEARHRRSYLYDVPTGRRTRLFHNNTVRTIAPEYAWIASPDGKSVLIAAERDGDTVSVERGVYLMDLTRKVTRRELRARLAANLAAEEALRSKTARMFAPIADRVKLVLSDASVARVFGYQKALFDFDSKHISQPGNRLASAFLFDSYESFGYRPEYQWFEPRAALGGRTANVLATLKGTVNPELVYVVSSHYDSVAIGPGADDDSSGTAALLETARLLARHPQPATIIFASFTGEESGLLGSREFVRRALAGKLHVVGALNNDMVGWANDHRLDNTIRYSNPGIRDVQHGAAIQFTNLITYDALYYKGTDAAAYYEAYGDIVGGIGSYPVLGNPHYHQAHDALETINHQLVTEVAKTTAATLMLLASSPSRLTDVNVDSFRNGTATVSWKRSPEKSVTRYRIVYGPPDQPEARQTSVTTPSVALKGVTPGTVVSVKAIDAQGLEGWDWAKVVVQ